MGIVKTLLVSGIVHAVNDHRMHYSSVIFASFGSIRKKSCDRLVILDGNNSKRGSLIRNHAISDGIADCLVKGIPAVFLCSDICCVRELARRYAGDRRVYFTDVTDDRFDEVLQHRGCVIIHTPQAEGLGTDMVMEYLIYLYTQCGRLFHLFSYNVPYPEKVSNLLGFACDGTSLRYTVICSALKDLGCSVEKWNNSGGGLLCIGSASAADASVIIGNILGKYNKIQNGVTMQDKIGGYFSNGQQTSVNTDLFTLPSAKGGILITREQICRYGNIVI